MNKLIWIIILVVLVVTGLIVIKQGSIGGMVIEISPESIDKFKEVLSSVGWAIGIDEKVSLSSQDIYSKQISYNTNFRDISYTINADKSVSVYLVPSQNEVEKAKAGMSFLRYTGNCYGENILQFNSEECVVPANVSLIIMPHQDNISVEIKLKYKEIPNT